MAEMVLEVTGIGCSDHYPAYYGGFYFKKCTCKCLRELWAKNKTNLIFHERPSMERTLYLETADIKTAVFTSLMTDTYIYIYIHKKLVITSERSERSSY